MTDAQPRQTSKLLTAVLVLTGTFAVSTRAHADDVRVLVWDEQQPEQKQAYDNFLGNWIASYLKTQKGLAVRSARLADSEQGLSKEALDKTDVLIWWGHQRHRDIKPATARDIVQRIKDGKLSLIALHSAHWSAPFVEAMNERAITAALKRLPEAERQDAKVKLITPKPFTVPKYDDPLTPSVRYRKKPEGAVEITLTLPRCVFPAYRADGKPSQIRTLVPDHPIAKGLPAQFTIPRTEMYDEPFHVPEPDAVIFEERWERGDWFRSGCLWQVGKGKVFYFRPGHELYPVYKQREVLQLLANAARWLGNPPASRSSVAGDDSLRGLQLLQGPWLPGPITGESVLFVQGNGSPPAAKLLFDADKILAVRSADGKQAFVAGKDFRLTADGSGLTLLPESRIPFRTEAELFPRKGASHSIGHRAGHPGTSLLFGEGHYFHDMQVEISYMPQNDSRWTGYRPNFSGTCLPGTLDRLRKKQPLTIGVSGDSISQGYNASGYTKAPPFMPPYPNLVAAQLERTYGSKVTLYNRAIAGWSVNQGVRDLDNLLKNQPNLVIIAYGMNDVGGRNPDGFKANIATMLKRIKAADQAIEVILVASMLGNPEWAATPPEMFPKYRDALAALQGPGVAMVDLTAVWQRLLQRKRFVDMTGNGVNHPNDYGHRLYAQAILALLIDRN